MRKLKSSITACAAILFMILLLMAGSGGLSKANDTSPNSSEGSGSVLNATEPNSSGNGSIETTGETIVGIGRGTDHAAVAAQAIANAGGLET